MSVGSRGYENHCCGVSKPGQRSVFSRADIARIFAPEITYFDLNRVSCSNSCEAYAVALSETFPVRSIFFGIVVGGSPCGDYDAGTEALRADCRIDCPPKPFRVGDRRVWRLHRCRNMIGSGCVLRNDEARIEKVEHEPK